MKVEEIMNKNPVFVEPDTPVQEIVRIMKEKKIGCVIVKNKKPQGIVTTRDIVFKHLGEGKGQTAKDIMTTDLVTVSPNKTIEDAAALMVAKHIERLPVMHYGKLVGIISTTDILRAEPELYKNVLEGLKMGKGGFVGRGVDFGQCESCGNYSDDLEEVNGQWLCEECREAES